MNYDIMRTWFEAKVLGANSPDNQSMDYKRGILNFSFVIPDKVAGMARPGVANPLNEDLSFLRNEGVKAIVSLSETPLEETVVSGNGFSYLHVPVDDFTAPTIEQVEECMDFMWRMTSSEEKPVVVHCGAGCGRTGTIIACYLLKRGETADTAIEILRSVRPCSIETETQKALVYQYEEYLKYLPPMDER